MVTDWLIYLCAPSDYIILAKDTELTDNAHVCDKARCDRIECNVMWEA